MRFNLNSGYRMSSKSIYTSISNSTSFKDPNFIPEQGTMSDGRLEIFAYGAEKFCERYQCGYQGGGQNQQPIYCTRYHVTLVDAENNILIPYDKNPDIALNHPGTTSNQQDSRASSRCTPGVIGNAYHFVRERRLFGRPTETVSVYYRGELKTSLTVPVVGYRGTVETMLNGNAERLSAYREAVRTLKGLIKY